MEGVGWGGAGVVGMKANLREVVVSQDGRDLSRGRVDESAPSSEKLTKKRASAHPTFAISTFETERFVE